MRRRRIGVAATAGQDVAGTYLLGALLRRDYDGRAMAPDAPVFISYSRKDYYFAESLAFHLLRRGVPAWMDVKDLNPGGDWERELESALDAASTVVLVASPDSVASQRVRAEWQHARERGCRIVVVRFRHAALPAELLNCDAVDFRGRFGRALQQLLGLLSGARPGGPNIPEGKNPWPVVPPWVALMMLALAAPTLAYFMASSWKIDDDDVQRAILFVAVPFFVAGLVWFFCVAFLRRRMGMTRLGLCLTALALVFAGQLYVYWAHDPATLANNEFARNVGSHWKVSLLLIAMPMAGLVILFSLRPEDLLRWTPTGKAWASYRLGRVADAAFRRADLAFQFGQMKTFTLASDPADAPMAQRLREQLIAAGATEAPLGDAVAMPVVLLTNRTQFGWIDAQTARVRDSGLTIVGTGIGLPSSLDWLWRRQWIDFRTWNMRRTDVALSLPQVPDAVTQARLPASVARVRHVLCAIAALMFALTGGVTADDAARSDGLSGYELIACLSFGVVVWWMLIAHRLVKRTRAASLLVRDWRIAWAVTAIVACIDSYALAKKGVAPARILLAMTLLVAAGIWLSRQRAGLAFWLPGEGGNAAVKGSVLGQSRDWSTLMWSSAYLLLWIPIIGSAG